MLPRHNRLFFRKLTFSFPRRSLSPFILILVLDLIRAPKLMCPTLDRPLSTPTFIGILSHLVSSQLQVFYNYFHRYISSLGQTTLKNYYSWFQIILSFSNSLYSLLRVMIRFIIVPRLFLIELRAHWNTQQKLAFEHGAIS